MKLRYSLSWSLPLVVSYCFCNKILQNQWRGTSQIYYLQFWSSDVQNESHWAAVQASAKSNCALFLEALRENLFPCSFQLQEVACISWGLDPFHFQSEKWNIKSLLSSITLTLTLLPLLRLLRILTSTWGPPKQCRINSLFQGHLMATLIPHGQVK